MRSAAAPDSGSVMYTTARSRSHRRVSVSVSSMCGDSRSVVLVVASECVGGRVLRVVEQELYGAQSAQADQAGRHHPGCQGPWVAKGIE